MIPKSHLQNGGRFVLDMCWYGLTYFQVKFTVIALKYSVMHNDKMVMTI